MTASMNGIFRMMLFAFFLGIAFGVLYDVFRITRVMLGTEYKGAKKSSDFLYSKKYPLIGSIKKKKSKKALLNIAVIRGDLVYCFLIGICLCIFFYYTNDGEVRPGALVVVFLGFLLYYNTIGRIVIFFAETICILLKIISKILLLAIAIPIKKVYNNTINIVKCAVSALICPILIKIRASRTKKLEELLISEAENGLILDYMKGKAFEDAIRR